MKDLLNTFPVCDQSQVFNSDFIVFVVHIHRIVWLYKHLMTKLVFFSETLPVEYMGGKPLCMNQYYEVLSSCRIPGLKRDSIVNHAKSSPPPKHITVVHNFQVRSLF